MNLRLALMTEIFSLKAISAAITSFWARSAILLWCLAASCLAVLVALAAGAHWQVGDAPALLVTYGTILGLAFLVLLIFAAFKTYGDVPIIVEIEEAALLALSL